MPSLQWLAVRINKRINIDTIAPAIIGNSYKGVKVTGLLDFRSAQNLYDVKTVYFRIKSLLPTTAIAPWHEVMYVSFQLPDGSDKVFAVDWITTATDSVIKNYEITLNDSVKTITEITDALRLAGLGTAIIKEV